MSTSRKAEIGKFLQNSCRSVIVVCIQVELFVAMSVLRCPTFNLTSGIGLVGRLQASWTGHNMSASVDLWSHQEFIGWFLVRYLGEIDFLTRGNGARLAKGVDNEVMGADTMAVSSEKIPAQIDQPRISTFLLFEDS